MCSLPLAFLNHISKHSCVDLNYVTINHHQSLEKIMKKYLSTAVILSAVFLGFSAQAQQPAAPVANAPAAAPAAGTAMKAASPASITYAKDRAECDALASAPSTEGAAPSDADKEAAIKKCLTGKGHNTTEITTEEAQRALAMAPHAVPAAPSAH
jgi:hypothetical protein